MAETIWKRIFQQAFAQNGKLTAQDPDVAELNGQFSDKAFAQVRVGMLPLPSGRIELSDPLCYLNTKYGCTMEQLLPAGEYPVDLAILPHPVFGPRVLSARLSVTTELPVRYELAMPQGHTIADKNAPGVLALFGVDTGLACICDKEAATAGAAFLDQWHADNPDKNHYDDYFATIMQDYAKQHPDYQRDSGSYLQWTVPGTGHTIFIFNSGFGDGAYSGYWGYDAQGRLACLVARFADSRGFDTPTPEHPAELSCDKAQLLADLDAWQDGGKYDNIVSALGAISQEQWGIDLYIRLAQAQNSLGCYSDAFSTLRQVEHYCTNCFDWFYQAGIALYHLDALPQARYALQKAHSCNPENTEAAQLLHRTLAELEYRGNMVKLYRKDPKGLHYVEYWVNETATATVHSGVVGTVGKAKQVPCEDATALRKAFTKEHCAQSYVPQSALESIWIAVQFPLSPFDLNTQALSPQDAALRDTAQSLLDESLGWNGLGGVDGWEVGRRLDDPGQFVLNIFCVVVDGPLAADCIRDTLSKKLDCTNLKLGMRKGDQDDYTLLYAANKHDQNFSL